MRSSRSEFLKGLRTRLQSDIALREAERDEEATGPQLEPIDEPEVEQEEPLREQIAADRVDTAAASRPAPIEPQDDAGPETVAPAEPHRPGNRVGPIGPSPVAEEDLGPYPSASWAEAGMPLRLRDAIASVRRVSHELYQGAPRDPDAMPAPPHADYGRDEDFIPHHEQAPGPPWDDGPAGPEDRPADGHGQRPAEQVDRSANEILFNYEPTGDDSSSATHQLCEFERAFQREQIELEDGVASEERPPGNELVLQSDQRMLDDGAAYEEPITRDEAPHERMRLDSDDEDEEPASGPGEELHDRLPARRGTTAGYGVHVTALAAAIVFVALAGFGFAMLSDSAGPEGPSAERDTATAGPALPPGLSPPPAETQPVAPLDELVTVRVAPPPGNALAEPASVAPSTPSRALPLPPPRKPELPQAPTDQAPSDGQPDDAVDAAAIVPALSEEPVDHAGSAPSEADGTGGPFEPLFAKLPASRGAAGQVLVQYTADSAGGPATAMHLVRQLKAAGFSVEARAVQFSILANSIRYFFPGDRDQAEALRASLEGQLPGGAALSVMDFTSFEPKPQEGHLEVWLRS
jgi:hypothetical protein